MHWMTMGFGAGMLTMGFYSGVAAQQGHDSDTIRLIGGLGAFVGLILLIAGGLAG